MLIMIHLFFYASASDKKIKNISDELDDQIIYKNGQMHRNHGCIPNLLFLQNFSNEESREFINNNEFNQNYESQRPISSEKYNLEADRMCFNSLPPITSFLTNEMSLNNNQIQGFSTNQYTSARYISNPDQVNQNSGNQITNISDITQNLGKHRDILLTPEKNLPSETNYSTTNSTGIFGFDQNFQNRNSNNQQENYNRNYFKEHEAYFKNIEPGSKNSTNNISTNPSMNDHHQHPSTSMNPDLYSANQSFQEKNKINKPYSGMINQNSDKIVKIFMTLINRKLKEIDPNFIEIKISEVLSKIGDELKCKRTNTDIDSENETPFFYSDDIKFNIYEIIRNVKNNYDDQVKKKSEFQFNNYFSNLDMKIYNFYIKNMSDHYKNWQFFRSLNLYKSVTDDILEFIKNETYKFENELNFNEKLMVFKIEKKIFEFASEIAKNNILDRIFPEVRITMNVYYYNYPKYSLKDRNIFIGLYICKYLQEKMKFLLVDLPILEKNNIELAKRILEIRIGYIFYFFKILNMRMGYLAVYSILSLNFYYMRTNNNVCDENFYFKKLFNLEPEMVLKMIKSDEIFESIFKVLGQ
ncbi:hypothetical protein DMUE_5273 [Dictyocoela muelleri]|nr:hypothetical protein DMUE_5273 [Dictyocoela muelleri]